MFQRTRACKGPVARGNTFKEVFKRKGVPMAGTQPAREQLYRDQTTEEAMGLVRDCVSKHDSSRKQYKA